MSDSAINEGLRIALTQVTDALRRHGIEPSGDYGVDIERLAVAPELLSALERMEFAFHLLLQGKSVRDADEVFAEARKAIAKAKGHSL